MQRFYKWFYLIENDNYIEIKLVYLLFIRFILAILSVIKSYQIEKTYKTVNFRWRIRHN